MALLVGINLAQLVLIGVVSLSAIVSSCPFVHPVEAPPCSKPEEMKNIDSTELSEMRHNFYAVDRLAQNLHSEAKEVFPTVPNECNFIDTGLTPKSKSTGSSNIDFDAINRELVEYYHNLTRFALHTGRALLEEEQRSLNLSSSFYSKLVEVKEHLFNGTVMMRRMLLASGYGCIEDQHERTTIQSEGCDNRFIHLVTIISQLQYVSREVYILLFSIVPENTGN